MPRSRTLHGAAPDQSPHALLITDLISDFRFEDGARLLREALPVARRIARLKERAREAGVPVIYVNDNRGRWRPDRAQLIARCLEQDSPGRKVVELLRPLPEDYFILKPKHSGFFATPLAALLEHLGTQQITITGATLEQCVLFTAMDAYLRDFDIEVPSDCVVALFDRHFALQHLRKVLHARTPTSARIRFKR
jgi:nicotinamidase-related amidase